MRGFLQHIAATAARLERTVHPFVGAMFQSAPWHEVNEASSPLEQASWAEIVEHPTTQIAAPEPFAANHGADVASEGPRAEWAAVAEPKRVELLVPRKVAELEDPFVREKESNEPWREYAKGQQVFPAAGVRRQEIEREAASTNRLLKAGPLVFRPLLVGDMPKRDGIADEVGVARRPSQEKQGAIPARLARRQSAAHGASPGTEMHGIDDIQIHIGRIEVVAVTPAPAARTVKPIRKSLSLDEYLKRHDGRGS